MSSLTREESVSLRNRSCWPLDLAKFGPGPVRNRLKPGNWPYDKTELCNLEVFPLILRRNRSIPRSAKQFATLHAMQINRFSPISDCWTTPNSFGLTSDRFRFHSFLLKSATRDTFFNGYRMIIWRNWDLLRVLSVVVRFVEENIEQFGGDASNISLMGHGTGAACVNLLMISPVATNGKKLFQRAILLSGSALVPGAVSHDPKKYAVELARAVKCPVEGSSMDMVRCLKTKSVEELNNVQLEVPQWVNGFHGRFKHPLSTASPTPELVQFHSESQKWLI